MMKKATNVVHGIVFYMILPFVGIIYLVHDSFKKPKKEELKPNTKFYTTTPEGYTGKDFNEWANNLYELTNN